MPSIEATPRGAVGTRRIAVVDFVIRPHRLSPGEPPTTPTGRARVRIRRVLFSVDDGPQR